MDSVYNSSTFAATPYLYVWYHKAEDVKIDSSLEYPAREEWSEQEISIYALILGPYWCQPASYSHMLKCKCSQVFFPSSLAEKNKAL